MQTKSVSKNVNKMGGDKKTNKTPMEIINMDRKTELKRQKFTLAVLKLKLNAACQHYKKNNNLPNTKSCHQQSFVNKIKSHEY